MSIQRQIFEIIRLTVIEILAIINWYSKIAVSNIVYLLKSILLTLTSTLMHFSLYQNSMVISSVLDCESVWMLSMDMLNTICNHDCFADCSFLIVSFWKIAFLVCRWKQTRGQSNLTKSASRGAHSPVRGHPWGSKLVPLNSWGRFPISVP